MMMCVLIVISIWDLVKKEIPILLLIAFSIVSVLQMVMRGGTTWMMICLPVVLLLGCGMFMVQKKKMGGGDVWVLLCLAVAGPLEVFWKSVMYGSMILCVVALGIMILTKNENVQIPMVPFLLLGYCM